MNRIYIYIALLLFLLHQEGAFGQEIDNQFWLNYSLKVKTQTNLSYGGDVGVRGIWSNYDWNQVLIRPSANYKFNKIFSVALATAIFYTDNIYTSNITEFRIHQDLNVEWLQTKWFSMFSRLRVEQRFFTFQDDKLPNEFRVRARLLLGAQSQDLEWFGSKRPIYFQMIYEGFQSIDADNNEFLINQARFHIAYGHRIAKNWRYELHFINQSSRLYENSGLKVSQQIFRLRLFHTINLSKSVSPIPEDEEDRVDDFN